jgi:hypothetical protein
MALLFTPAIVFGALAFGFGVYSFFTEKIKMDRGPRLLRVAPPLAPTRACQLDLYDIPDSVFVLDVSRGTSPGYRCWAGFGLGSSVTLAVTGGLAGTDTKIEATTTLVETGTIKVVLETTGRESFVADHWVELKKEQQSFPSSWPDRQDGSIPAEGDEEIVVAGRKLTCHWIETRSTDLGGNVHTKVWRSTEVPGGLVRLDATVEGSLSTKTHAELVGFEVK